MSLPPNSPRTRSSSSSSYASSITSTGTSVNISSNSKSENVQVAVRVRPPSASELSKPGSDIWETDTVLGKLSLNAEYASKLKKQTPEYNYDAVLIGSDNRLLYERCVRDVVRSTMEGYNGTVFAYGQTASGKTYTMTGVDSQPGVIPQAVEDVFQYIQETAGNREFLLRVSYMEIYNETIRDLLSPEVTDLRIHEDKRRGVYVSPLREEIVTSPKQVMKVIQRGEANRHISATDYNEHSSRSHTIFQMVIESRDPRSAGRMTPISRRFASNKSSLGGGVKISLLNLIDLAGSEKASSSADRRKESAYINKSLLTLGNVISKLTEDKGGHIPYRDSKLTRILQSALSGNSRVSVTCTISPSGINLEESNNTLKFAAKVKKVVTRAETTQVMDDKALLQKYKMEIMELKAKLMHTNEAFIKDKEAELSQLKEEKRKYEEDLMEAQLARTSLKERIDHLTKLILTSNSISPKVLLDRTKRQFRPTSVNFGLSNMAVNEAGKKSVQLEQELSQKNNTIKTLMAEISCKDDYIMEIENLIQSVDSMEIKEKFLGLPKPDNQRAHSITIPNDSRENQEEVNQEMAKLQKLTQEFEKLTDQQETKITTLEEQLRNLRESTELEFTKTEEYQEMNRELEEQRQVITELEEEVKDNKNLIAELRNVIRKMELSLFEKAEVSSAAGKGNSNEDLAKNRTTEENSRIKELEQLLEKERKLRQEEQNASTERIAELEAELTISQAELSVAQLISGFSGKTSS